MYTYMYTCYIYIYASISVNTYISIFIFLFIHMYKKRPGMPPMPPPPPILPCTSKRRVNRNQVSNQHVWGVGCGEWRAPGGLEDARGIVRPTPRLSCRVLRCVQQCILQCVLQCDFQSVTECCSKLQMCCDCVAMARTRGLLLPCAALHPKYCRLSSTRTATV